ncbi:LysM peptidoglycan-binding domain-containing protein [Arthrospiribacter ruber]|uniref:LysM peptidoglycan-binding domain-containing protein n=1 Tax=Arthrospiribacter ruber TaxID=2487934 RepID=A0A951IRL2_9BACT|nr:LysM peptidoglycan-binding domain-containing protein [Arthrospiribacter ruber]MBW3466545.1 LysM peptidoglycan-binding domain-containing protein [Arthrospiribacter ruber]
MKNLLVLCLVFLSFQQLKAMDLTPMDSVGVEKVGDKTFIVHEVSQGETLFGISRRYEVAVNDILQNNEKLQEGLKIGQRIRIPYVAKEALPAGATLHKVAPGETLFSISKRYNASVGEVMEWNKLQGNDLSVGQALIIKNQPVAETKPEPSPGASTQTATTTRPAATPTPQTSNAEKAVEEKPKETAKPEIKEENLPKTPASTGTPAATTASPSTSKALPGDWITHTVEQGETLFSIAKKYDARIDDVISWNALSSNNLSAGQKLKVGREKATAANVPVVPSSVPIVVNNEKREGQLVGKEDNEESTAYKNVKETGLAEVIEGTGNHKKYLVLHRDAPVGTIMRVRNEENDQTIFARVVGKLPDTGDNSRLVIKLSKAAFDQLRAVNTRFPVEISY